MSNENHQNLAVAVSTLEPANKLISASDFLKQAEAEMQDRAKTYDAEDRGGERSMANTVAAFNAITGHTLSEEQGWKFMALLKIVRSEQGAFRADNFTDLAAYAALSGEAARAQHSAST